MLRVMGMFGKDLVGHFLFVLTFADIKEALVIAALK
jgi:hypothetical protein